MAANEEQPGLLDAETIKGLLVAMRENQPTSGAHETPKARVQIHFLAAQGKSADALVRTTNQLVAATSRLGWFTLALVIVTIALVVVTLSR